MSLSTNLDRSVPATEFILFPNLPLEIQLKIWRSIEQPRVIHIKAISTGNALKWTCRTSSVLQFMRVNHQARAELVKFYKQPFRTNQGVVSVHDNSIHARNNELHVYPGIDTLFFDLSNAVPSMPVRELFRQVFTCRFIDGECIKKLALQGNSVHFFITGKEDPLPNKHNRGKNGIKVMFENKYIRNLDELLIVRRPRYLDYLKLPIYFENNGRLGLGGEVIRGFQRFVLKQNIEILSKESQEPEQLEELAELKKQDVLSLDNDEFTKLQKRFDKMHIKKVMAKIIEEEPNVKKLILMGVRILSEEELKQRGLIRS